MKAAQEWKKLKLSTELWCSRFPEKEQQFAAVEESCKDGLLSKLHAQLDKTLSLFWNGNSPLFVRIVLFFLLDAKVNESSSKILKAHSTSLDTKSPLFALFCGYPIEEASRLLSLTCAAPLLPRFPDIFFARLYAVINEGFNDSNDEPFQAASLESLAPEHLCYATRLSTIMQSTRLICILHPELSEHFSHKCIQIIRQIRKTAEQKRRYSSLAAVNCPPARLNDLLNEITLIEQLIRNSELSLDHERSRWRDHAQKLEKLYLSSSISTSLAQDRVNSTGPFPVSTCIDEIFYVLQAALLRSRHNLLFVQDQVNQLMGQIKEGLQNERSLLPFLILLNNAIQVQQHYNTLLQGLELVAEQSLTETIVSEAVERLYQFIQSTPLPSTAIELIAVLKPTLPSVVTGTLAPVGLESFYLLHAKKVSWTLVTLLLESKESPKQSLSNCLQQQLQILNSDSSPHFQCKLLETLKRPQQAIALLEAGDEFDAILDDLKGSGELELRAGEILALRELTK